MSGREDAETVAGEDHAGTVERTEVPDPDQS
jgi:hypothetical protein